MARFGREETPCVKLVGISSLNPHRDSKLLRHVPGTKKPFEKHMFKKPDVGFSAEANAAGRSVSGRNLEAAKKFASVNANSLTRLVTGGAGFIGSHLIDAMRAVGTVEI